MKNAKEFLREKQISSCVGTMNDWVIDTSEGEVAFAMEQYARAYHEDILRLEEEGINRRENNQPMMDGRHYTLEDFKKDMPIALKCMEQAKGKDERPTVSHEQCLHAMYYYAKYRLKKDNK